MHFPRWAGWLGGRRRQVSDGFARSVLAGLLLDAAEHLHRPAEAEALRSIARREADRVAAARLRTRWGGWSYFPELPPLPPDLDSLAAATQLFARIAPEHLPLTLEPRRLALAEQDAAGACPTWLIHPHDPWLARQWMRLGVSWFWGAQRDVDVNARFASALVQAGSAEAARRVAGFVRQALQADPLGPATWYASPLYTTELCLPHAGPARAAALARLQARQAPDGGWPDADRPDGDPQASAIATWLLAEHDPVAARRGAAWLCSRQDRSGGWRATPFIRMEVGRASGRVRHVAQWGSATLNTAFALRALAAVQATDAPL
jgi:squalene-hopene/tetraprenyl-beta-curcumene cyclase